jgi:hypothetical protein
LLGLFLLAKQRVENDEIGERIGGGAIDGKRLL